MSVQVGTLFGGADGPDSFRGAKSLGHLCLKRLTGFGEQVILIDAGNNTQITAIALRDHGIRVANCLRAIGIRSGDTVAICTENRLEFVYVMLGTYILGVCLTPMNPSYTERELLHAVQLSRPKVVFSEVANAANFVAVAQQCSFLERLVVFDRAVAQEPTIRTFVQSYCAFEGNPYVAEVDGASYQSMAQDMAEVVSLVLYSSGTTGQPKGVQLTQKNSMLAVHRYEQLQQTNAKVVSVPITLSVVPFFHTFGYHVVMSTILFGHKLVTLPRFEPHAFLGAIQAFRCTNLYVAPPLMVFLAKSPLVDQYDVSSIRTILCGAAPLTAELQCAVYDRLRGPIIRQGYGMTEGTLSFTTQTDRCHAQGSVGELNFGVYGRVVNAETGRVLGPLEEGELQFRGNTMRGYVGNDEATAETIDADGWLRTGDIGFYTENGEWYVVDRLKELIKYKGFQVAPAELEGLLLKIPQISDCGVVGVADDVAGELPMAFVVRQPNAQLSEEEVVNFVRQQASHTKWLRGGVRFVAEIPKNPSGKILRRQLRALLNPTVSKL